MTMHSSGLSTRNYTTIITHCCSIRWFFIMCSACQLFLRCIV